ncbi:MAG TPA: hypothetical protein DDY49_06625 [Paenibacillaceae bacterium]|nr:hypothetical protein [Paenibacillaceae bacterium]
MSRMARILENPLVKVFIVIALLYGIINNILYFSSFITHKEERERLGVLTLDVGVREKDIHTYELNLRQKKNDLEKNRTTLDDLDKQIVEMENTGNKYTLEYQETVEKYNKLVKTYDPAQKDYEQLYGEYLNKVEEYNQVQQELKEVRTVTQNFYTLPSFVKEKTSSFEGISFEKWNPLHWGIWGSIATWSQDIWNQIQSWPIWTEIKAWIDSIINYVKERANLS